MKLVISNHAQQRLEEQNISQDFISEEIKQFPYSTEKNKVTLKDGTKIVYVDYDHRFREIVTVISMDKIISTFMRRNKGRCRKYAI